MKTKWAKTGKYEVGRIVVFWSQRFIYKQTPIKSMTQSILATHFIRLYNPKERGYWQGPQLSEKLGIEVRQCKIQLCLIVLCAGIIDGDVPCQ